MKVHRQLDQLPDFKNAVITIGSFDGVHAGHRQIINRLTTKASEIHGQSILITFYPHPRIVLDPKSHRITLLNSLNEKIQLIKELGVDHLVVAPFSKDFSQLSPESYIEDFLLKRFNPSVIIIGYDHKFGNDRSGDITMLKRYQNDHNFELIEIEKYLVQNIGVSSTKIRRALASTDVEQANSLLSYPYRLTGTVTRGDQIGRSLGYPTANLAIDETYKLIPPDGIYAATCMVRNEPYQGMLYIGSRPTVNAKNQQVIEVNLFDFDTEIYDEVIQIQLVKFIRSDATFNSMDELKSQINKDRHDVHSFFSITSPSQKKKCAVAVLNYNGEALLKKYVPDLIRYSPEADIVIIDNKSTDQSLIYLSSLGNQIQVIPLEENYGFAEGYNRAVQLLTSYSYTLLLNSDVRVTENWLYPLLSALDKAPGVAAVQPKIKSELQPDHFEYAGASGGFIDRWGFPFCRGRLFDEVEPDQGQYDSPIEVHWCSGAAMLIRTKLYLESGGLDPDYFAHQEEIDLCWRLRNAGYKLMAIPSSTVHHIGGATLSYSSPRKLYLNYRNNITTLIKNVPAHTLIWLLPWRFALDKLAAARFLFGGNLKSFFAVIRALSFEFFHLPSLLSKRKKAQKTTHSLLQKNNTANPQLPLTKNIIFPYFIKGLKKYSDLDL